MQAGAGPGVPIIDAHIHRLLRKEPERGGNRSFQHIRPYPDLEKAISRFRFLPDQACPFPFLKRYLAETSLKKTEDGWIWKFDRAMFEKIQVPNLEDYFPQIEIPFAFLRGQHSSVATPEIEQFLATRLSKSALFVEIPEAHHHIMLDQPLALITALRTILESWRVV